MTDRVKFSGYDNFIVFRSAIMQAIAKAWDDHQYRERLIANPVAGLKEIGYNWHYYFKLTVDVDNAVWQPLTVADWRVTKKNKIKLALPPRPSDPEQYTQALAALNARSLANIIDKN